jgi:glycosyltransferase involved in cell wall biosynthesis
MNNVPYNILYLCCDKGLPFWGTKGGSVHMREFVAALRSFGHRVTVVARDKSDRSESDDFISLPSRSARDLFDEAIELGGDRELLSESKQFYQNPNWERFLTKLHKKNEFGLVYERYSLFAIAGLSFARRAGIPFIFEVNAPLVWEALTYRGLVMKELAQAVEKRLFSSADRIIAVSDSIQKYVLSVAPGARVSVVPNGVNIDRFNIKAHESALDDIESSSEDNFTVAFIGNLRPWHGVEILIDAFAEFSRRSGRGKLLIIGGGEPLKKELERRCFSLGLDGKVTFTGAVPFEEIPGLLEIADVTVAPYPDLDNFYFSPLKILEYMAAGKAIIASKIGQVAQILSHEKTAFLIPPGDSRTLASVLDILYQDPALRKSLGINARNEACSRHTWKQRVAVIMNIIQSLRVDADRQVCDEDSL